MFLSRFPWFAAFGAITFLSIYLLSLTPTYPMLRWVVFAVLMGLALYHIEQFKVDVDGQTKTNWGALIKSFSIYGIFGVLGGYVGLRVFAE
ncbi:MAG: hypothetical protein QNJ44_15115 [Rhodobacter sp.]|nr:hypothetical protein [Rhodobacter sp.]